MEFDLAQRTASLGVGEFADFTLGPRDGGDGGRQGLWRAQLGTHWHQQLRIQTSGEQAAATFEVVIAGGIFHRGWKLTLSGRIDQLVPAEGMLILREIKTVTRPLPVDERELRADYPGYFAQLATYLALWRLRPTKPAEATPPPPALRGELVFVEAGSGLSQTVVLNPADDAVFRIQLERVTEFLDLRWRARERLRQLCFRPAFATHRPGQETTRADLDQTLSSHHGPILFEAPTGFGKTGMLLECALGQLQAGHFERVLYLTSKSTGQLQVVRTLATMNASVVESPKLKVESQATANNASASGPSTLNPQPSTAAAPATGAVESSKVKVESRPAAENASASDLSTLNLQLSTATAATSVATWHVRNKSEHCVNHTFHCVREECAFLNGAEARWAQSGLSRFYLLENEPRDLETLRAAGRAATLCPYEITRAALAFNDVWIGDYNYVFAPRNRGLFYDQPGFDPARTLLILDEAHNLPSRVADAHSHLARADDARRLLAELEHVQAAPALVRAWESWTKLLAALIPVDALDPALEADTGETLARIADQLATAPPDMAALGSDFAGLLWQTSELVDWLADARLKKLLWCPRAGELHFTCFDAAESIGETLRAYGGVVLASATLSPVAATSESCGLGTVTAPALVRAHTPWREGAYDIAFDARVDTSFHHRAKHHATTAATIEALHAAATQKPQITNSQSQTGQTQAVAVFFPSYAYAEAIQRALDHSGSTLRVALQPRLKDLAAQTAWVEESLVLADALFLVLGSSFAESIDLLGGRVTHAMVVGPALPEVNAVQRARLAELAGLGREEAFARVYQIPGMTKVNQALGRLVRAPGQRARVILHCQRFLEPSYARLLAPDYQLGTNLLEHADLTRWLET